MTNKVRALLLVLVILLVSYYCYAHSVFRVEYEFDTKLPESTEVVRIDDAWTWLPIRRECNWDRNIAYTLVMNQDEFAEYISSQSNCRECDGTLNVGSHYSFFPVKYGDVKHIYVNQVKGDQIEFDFMLNYN